MSELLAKSRQLRLMSSLEELFTSEYGFGVTTATPMQRAILRAAGGVPLGDLATPDTLKAFGGYFPKGTPLELCILSGIRGGKTLIACALAVWATQHVRLDVGAGKNIRPGETPRVSVLSRTMKLAKKSFSYIKGAVLAKPALRELMVGEPKVDTITLRHPSGVPIEITVTALSSAGSSLISDWSAGVIFDEAPRMASEDEGLSANLEESIRAVRGRMLDNAVVMYIGSPWGQTGAVYDIVSENWGKEDPDVLVVRARGDQMNPFHWTPERCEALRQRDPDAHKTDVLAEFRDPETALLAAASVDACSRTDPLVIEPEEGGVYTAFMDPAASSNSWTFGIADTRDNMRFRVCMLTQWTGAKSEPLSPKRVLEDVKPLLDKYGISTVLTDQFSSAALVDIGRDLGVQVSPITITPALKLQMYESMRVRFDAGMLEVPADPAVRSDLLSVKKRLVGGAGASGGIKIVLPVTADGRHCDYAAAIALLCGQYLAVTPEKIVEPLDEPGEETDTQPREWWEEREDEVREERMEQGAGW